jgi:hypothetical protein
VGEYVTQTQLIEQGDCFWFYKFDNPMIYAIKESEFDVGVLNNHSDFSDELIPSGIELGYHGVVSEGSPLDGMTVVLDITGLDDNVLNIRKSKVVYSYTDGTFEEKFFTSDVLPEPSRGDMLPWWLYVILPVIAIVVIVFIVLRRKSGK